MRKLIIKKVTEYLSSGSLVDVLQKLEGKLTSEELVDMYLNKCQKTLFFTIIFRARQAAAGMKYLENNNVIHRDLALRNLLASQTGENRWNVKVRQFDFCR